MIYREYRVTRARVLHFARELASERFSPPSSHPSRGTCPDIVIAFTIANARFSRVYGSLLFRRAGYIYASEYTRVYTDFIITIRV